MWRYLIYKIDSFFTKTLSILNLGVIGIIIGLLSIDAINFKNKDEILVGLLIIFSIILLCIFLSKATIYFIWLKSTNNMPVGEKLDYKCQFIEETNGLFTQVQYLLKNNSINPQRTILYDFEGINTDLAFTPQYGLINRSQHENNGEIKICGYDKKIPLQKFEDYANPNELIHQADWSVMIEPPLEPNEKIKFLRLSYEKDIYIKSIKGEETDFSFRPRIPFRTLNITIIPPIGFIVSKYEIIIDNQKGKKFQIPNFLIKNSINVIGGNLIWMIPFPKITIRYKLKFELQKII